MLNMSQNPETIKEKIDKNLWTWKLEPSAWKTNKWKNTESKNKCQMINVKDANNSYHSKRGNNPNI